MTTSEVIAALEAGKQVRAVGDPDGGFYQLASVPAAPYRRLVYVYPDGRWGLSKLVYSGDPQVTEKWEVTRGPRRVTYVGPVARIREEMERERAAAALGGGYVPEPDNCALSQEVLRAQLLTYPSLMVVNPRRWRPWRIGTDMIGPKWMWAGVARVLNDPEVKGLVQVWTRKAHRAWRRETYATSSVAAAILRGEVKDPWS